MAYNPTNWQAGDIVTAEKLNNIEQGISGLQYDLIFSALEDGEGNDVYTVISGTYSNIVEKLTHGDFVQVLMFNSVYDEEQGTYTQQATPHYNIEYPCALESDPTVTDAISVSYAFYLLSDNTIVDDGGGIS